MLLLVISKRARAVVDKMAGKDVGDNGMVNP
jgi:hypothetical protein